jgi:hypothetical protein
MAMAMKEFLELFFNFLQYCLKHKIIKSSTALFCAFVVFFIHFIVLRIEHISHFICVIKEQKEREFIRRMQDVYLPSDTKECAQRELERRKTKNLFGLNSVFKQHYCIDLVNKYSELIQMPFLVKFQNYIVPRNNFTPSIKIGKKLWIEWVVGCVITLQFFILAAFFIFLDSYYLEALSFWKHVVVWLFVMVILGTGVIMSKQFPSREEINLLREIKRREELAKH